MSTQKKSSSTARNKKISVSSPARKSSEGVVGDHFSQAENQRGELVVNTLPLNSDLSSSKLSKVRFYTFKKHIDREIS